MPDGHRSDPDVMAARAVGAGVGLIALMVSWLVGNRLLGALVGPPAGVVVAFAFAISVGLAVAILAGRRLVRSAKQELRRAD